MSVIFLPLWPLLAYIWWLNTGGWRAIRYGTEGMILWLAILVLRGFAAHRMEIPIWYAFTTPLGAGIFAAMISPHILEEVFWKTEFISPDLV
jgi:hypothetical protein